MSKLVFLKDFLSHPMEMRYKLVCLFPSIIKDDRKYIEYMWRHRMDYPLNLDNPQTYNEKIQWLKLYDRNPIYTSMVDKVDAKKIVSNIIGEDHIIPTIAVYNTVDEIDFDKLPNQFVLKCTHDSGGVVICKDKSSFDKKAALNLLKRRLKINFYYRYREWPYKNVKPRIIAEKYMEDGDEGGLKDYKFFCFNGTPKAIFILKDRHIDTRLNFYDMEFNKLPFERGYPNFEDDIEKPKEWSTMVELAKKLSQDIPQVRVDFYDINGVIYFGELTFFPGSGFEQFYPQEWDYVMGEWIKLPICNKC